MTLPAQKDIQNVARDVLRELTGTAPTSAERPRGRALISQAEVRAAKARGDKLLLVPPGAIVTPLARDAATECKVEIREEAAQGTTATTTPNLQEPGPADAGPAPAQEGGTIALGADHGGFPLKESIRAHLEQQGASVADLGTHSKDSCDYPDFAAAVAKSIALGQSSWGILVDGAGIGSCMAANKVPGVLAATCHDERTARNSREHNGANVLCLGSGSVDEATALRIVDAWLATAFAGGRHGRRVGKIKAIERGFLR